MSEILGVNTRWLPSIHEELNGRVAYCVVLVSGDIGDYAAYSGFVKGDKGNPTASEIDFIRTDGDKIRFEEACCHFPGSLEREKYRN